MDQTLAVLFPHGGNGLADEKRRICAGPRLVFLRAPAVDFRHVEVAILMVLSPWTPHMPPGKSPQVPHEYRKLPFRSS